jgi:hypothetical protein
LADGAVVTGRLGLRGSLAGRPVTATWPVKAAGRLARKSFG